ncbi:NeuD/PglB/VioB family sugar acetyltransferase [Pedobacter immunditicola]|uniref:NeuD/PglB/VioB family sugar acetyltransferase n=1 Tax=Pedobacter immunditicola TaxID=3133440 RepID=UPI0030ACB51F
MKKLLIFPFNGNGIEALDCINDHEYDFLGFIDDNSTLTSTTHEIFPRAIIKKHPEICMLAVPGSYHSYKERAAMISSLEISEERFITAIHPRATVGKHVQIGYNCLIMAGVVITSNARLHNHICILPNSVIHHDVTIDDYTLIGSNVLIAGSTDIGSNCYIGSGSNIINGIHIGERTLVGLGSNVLKSVPENSKVAGNPAKYVTY